MIVRRSDSVHSCTRVIGEILIKQITKKANNYDLYALNFSETEVNR